MTQLQPSSLLIKNIEESFRERLQKPLAVGSLSAPEDVREPTPFPTSSLTRVLTGDLKPEWLSGLGRMQREPIVDYLATSKALENRTIKPGETVYRKDESGNTVYTPWHPVKGQEDVFVSSLDEYARKGSKLNLTDKEHETVENDVSKLVKALDLDKASSEKVQAHGAWLMVIHPGLQLAIPTARQGAFEEYMEGGYTKSGQQEWVTTNKDLHAGLREGTIRIFKIDPNGKTVEWKSSENKLYAKSDWDKVIKERASKKPAA